MNVDAVSELIEMRDICSDSRYVDGNKFNSIDEATSMAIEALDKQIPKPPYIMKCNGVTVMCDCPNCENDIQEGANYCSFCGQKIDWSEE